MRISNIFHRWLNPHCPDCQQADENIVVNELREQLVQERLENRRLIDVIINFNKPAVAIPVENVARPVPIPGKPTWRQRAAELERNDRENAIAAATAKAEATLLENKPKVVESVIIDKPSTTIEELEDELGVANAGS